MNIAVSSFLVIATTVGILEIYGFFLLLFVLFFDHSCDADYYPILKMVKKNGGKGRGKLNENFLFYAVLNRDSELFRFQNSI